MSIKVLAPEVRGKIAAGEVVERPASVVKELVENSLDAGARSIRVEVHQGGRRFIQVTDDGVGIPADEVELAFARYATSKLEEIDDLARIGTLGFRGEALSSIAAVGKVEMITRAEGEELGTYLRLEGGEMVERGKRGAPRGTMLKVRDLFYNVPARRKFLRSPATEMGHISDWVSRYAMAYPQVRFSLESEGRLLLQTSGNGKLFDVLIEVYGIEVAQEMIEVSEERVEGYVSLPKVHRSTRRDLTFLVNRRWVHDRMLNYAVEEAYHAILPKGRHPIAILNIILDPSQMDVNVHPTKREVRFLYGSEVFSTVQKAVRSTLSGDVPLPAKRVTLTEERRRGRLGDVAPWEMGKLGLEVQRTGELPGLREPGEVSPGRKLPMLRVLGQLALSYIVAEGPEGLYMIDQHAAHERVLYERFREEHAKLAVVSQVLLEPLILELTPQQEATIRERLEVLVELGFQMEPFGGRLWLVRVVPAMLKDQDLRQIILEIIDEAKDSSSLGAWEEEMVKSLACHGARKAGQTLPMEEMRELIRQMEETAFPFTCPHGRPTIILMSTEDLGKEFGQRRSPSP